MNKKMSSTGNPAKSDIKNQKNRKKKQIKTNLALISLLGVAAAVGLGYVVYRNREALASGGSAAAKAMGPVISRLLPALVLGLLSMVVGPEGAIAGIPLGLFFGPEIVASLAGVMGGGGAGGAIGAGAGGAVA